MASAVANRYARALVDVVMAPGSPLKPEDAVAQLRAVDAIFQESSELRNACLRPPYKIRASAPSWPSCWREPVRSTLIRNFIYVLIDHRRIAIIGEIREAFELQLDERLGFVRAEVTSAAPLDQRAGRESGIGIVPAHGEAHAPAV